MTAESEVACLVRQAVQGSTALSSLYRTIFAALAKLKQVQTPVRYVGVFSDGGVSKALDKYAVENMCAPSTLSLVMP